MGPTRLLSNLVSFGLVLVCAAGCGEPEPSAAMPATTPPAAPVAPTAPVEPVVVAPPPPPAVPAVTYTGEWSIADAPFVPAAAVAVVSEDGSYEIVVSDPPVGCDFVRRGGDVPLHLRRLTIRGLAGREYSSESSNPDQQINLVYEQHTMMDAPGEVSTVTFLPREGTFTITPGEGVVHVAVTADNGFAPPGVSHVAGTIDAVLCD